MKLCLDVQGETLTLFNDGQEVAWASDAAYSSGTIALLNEGGPVYVDNVRVTRASIPSIQLPAPKPGAFPLSNEVSWGLLGLIIGLILGGALVALGFVVGRRTR